MAAGRDRSVGKNFTRKLEAATSIVKDHIVVSINSSGEVILATNTSNPYAITYRSTQDKFQQSVGKTTFNTGADIEAEIALLRSGWVELELGSTNIAIAIGDAIIVHADDDGTVNGAADPTTTAEKALVVGWAEEAKAVDVGGTILVALDLMMGGAT